MYGLCPVLHLLGLTQRGRSDTECRQDLPRACFRKAAARFVERNSALLLSERRRLLSESQGMRSPTLHYAFRKRRLQNLVGCDNREQVVGCVWRRACLVQGVRGSRRGACLAQGVFSARCAGAGREDVSTTEQLL